MTDGVDLASLLAIWPIAESFASSTPVGDMISLSRVCTSLRSVLHGRIPQYNEPYLSSHPRRYNFLDPEVGSHQTAHWAHLKAIAPFTCSSSTHTRGQTIKPCVYCSIPICDACIVRDSFKRPNEHTFKNRLRYFCRDCWSEGNPTQTFRYPMLAIGDHTDLQETADDVKDDRNDGENNGDNPHNEIDEFCTCNFKENGWLCLACKAEQNTAKTAPSNLLLDTDLQSSEVECYGLECTNTIDLGSPDKDRRRVCLWCQKPLRRQMGGEDRHAWNLKTIEARARNAESRSRYLEEYHRQRVKTMRMSRGEMRGTQGPGDNEPVFVRHLDTINYRNYMPQASAPDPGTVWKSKHGYWRYRYDFMFAMQSYCRFTKFTHIGGVPLREISAATRENGLGFARLNRELYRNLNTYLTKMPRHNQKDRNKWCMNELRARILDMHLGHGQDSNAIAIALHVDYGVDVDSYEIARQLSQWTNSAVRATDTSADPEHDDQAIIEGVILSPQHEGPMSPDLRSPILAPIDTREPHGQSAPDAESPTIDVRETTPTTMEQPVNDDPPPYIP